MKADMKKFLQDIKTDNELKRDFIKLLVRYEKKYQLDNGYSIREEITGPMVDELYLGSPEIFISELQEEIKFKYRYKSKIMRDFFLRHEELPDHFWEPQTTKLLRILSRNSKTVFVGGAYIGDQVVYIAKELTRNPDAKCYAFEPNLDSFCLLKDNCKLNNFNNIIINNKGLWYDNKKLAFVGNDSHAFSKEVDYLEDEGFDAVSINNYCLENNIFEIDLIMLDLEGGELNVLKGADNFLEMSSKKAPTIIFEIHSSYVNWKNGLQKTNIGEYLTEKGYFLYSIRDFQSNYPMQGCKIELIPAETTILDGPKHGFNMIAVKDESLLEHKHIVFCDNLSPKLLLHRDKKIHFPLHCQN